MDDARNIDEENKDGEKNDDVNNLVVVDDDENPYEKKKRKKTSKAWEEFKEITLPDGSKKAQCIHCKHKLSLSNTGATSQFLRHLNNCIKRRVNMSGQQQLSVTTTTDKSECVKAVQNFKYDQAKVREIASHMILVHELPFNFMEYELFNLFMRTATPNYTKISRTTSKNDCVASYEIEKKRLKTLLKDVNRVSVTTDLWRSGQKIQYMVLTCHFVDSNWKLQKRTLNFCDVAPPHTGLVICDALHKCLVEWGIEKKVWSITVDNASYNDVAVRMLKDSLSYQNKLPINGKLFHVRCCAHILNILVQDGLSEIQDIIEDVRESVKHISASEARLIMFSDIVKQLQLPGKKLILDCCTRWNATYAMLAAALEFKDVFPRYSQRDPSYHTLPSDEDWKKVENVCSFLEVFNDVTQIISGSEYPTSNLFLMELCDLKKLLDETSTSGDIYMRAMAGKMKNKFDKYWGDCNLLISMAAILDPRNKMKMVDWCFPSIYSEAEATMHITTIQETLHMLYSEYVAAHTSSNAEKSLQDENDTQNDTSSCNSGGKGKGKVSKRAKFDNFIRNVDTIQHVKSELDVYLEEGVYICDEDSNFDALEWWKMQNLKFRILSKMACDILSIPITTVASESAFSAGGRVIDPHRASLATDTVQVLLCGEDWFRGFYGIKRKGKDKEDTKEIRLL